jgi:hypothetical protein
MGVCNGNFNFTFMFYTLKSMIHEVAHFSRWVLNNPWTMGFLSASLVFVPILGMWAVHKYGWEHWEPFDKRHKK